MRRHMEGLSAAPHGWNRYRFAKLGFDIRKNGENVGNFRLISGLLQLEIGVVR